MTEPPDYAAYLRHIRDSIETIEEYLEGVSRGDFLDSKLHQDATIRQLEVIGEAVKQLPSNVTDKYPDIPWQDIAGMRDKLIHSYFSVDLETVWLTATTDLSALKHTVVELLADIG